MWYRLLVTFGGQHRDTQRGHSCSPLHRLATNSIPFVSDFSQEVVQFLSVIREQRLLFQGSACSNCSVIYRLFATKSFLELLFSEKKKKKC